LNKISKDFQPTQLTTNKPVNRMKVSVIICTYTIERFKDLYEAIQSVMNQTYKPGEIIIAVDHNRELFKRLKSELPSSIKVVLNTNTPGLSETRNVGIRAAEGEIVAFIDDDAIAEPNWLENLVKPFSQQPIVGAPSPHSPAPSPQSPVVAVGGRAVPLWLSGSRSSWFPEELDWLIGCTYKGLPIKTSRVLSSTPSSTPNLERRTSNLELKTIRNVPGCNMAFRKEVFGKVGYFRSEIGGLRETPRGGEEAELCLRIKHKMPEAFIFYESKALIHHKVPSWRLNLRYIARRSFNEGFYKAKVQKLLGRKTPNQTLSAENSYLRYLLFTSIPERVRKFYRMKNLLQAGLIVISMIATGLGYLTGKFKSR